MVSLIIDDDEDICDLFSTILSKLGKKHKIIKDLGDVDHLIDICKENKIELAIVDLNMIKASSGLDICKRLKDFDPSIVTILTSGSDISAAYDSVDKKLKKPFDVDSISDVVSS